ncbi:MAG: cell division protein FtsZ [Bacilli bacterium]|jgi:cell division protein FtsZ|nr:cell division protein FtsZ [Bacilli bacterium]NCA94611.1 cell division protein FtsZ [Campylobacterota bacterium]NLB39952.1 cell division protein FtsZ [Erysipelotrichaceae bacterium]HOF53911.1 cell division protein FtsZ [Bacilli bacterium]HOR20951.1 cell division protein FtsZ [Bacilli bacterium]
MQGSELDNFEPIARIVVIGVGGAGNNAVNRMIDEDLGAVEFFVANTDRQTLATSKARNRIILGPSVTGGLGAGGEPSVGREAATASVDDIRKVVKGANMVFIAAGMGGGTGTGAAPVVAQVAREEGALTVAIVTRPFTFEGKKRIANSVEGLNELKDAVDAIIIVSNDKLLMVSGTQPISEAFAESDRVLAQSVKTVTDLILMPAIINLDFADIRNTLKDSGISLIGFGLGQGPNRAQEAAQNAINSPLLEASINGARRAICSVTCGPNVSLYEAQEAVDLVIEAAGNNIDVKFGVAINNQLTDQILVSVIASDFTEEFDFTSVPNYSQQIRLQRADGEKVNGASDDKPKKEAKEAETEAGEAASEDSILPSFLKNRHID